LCTSDTATFEFHATEDGSSFECTLEGEGIGRGGGGGGSQQEPCTSPQTYELEDNTQYTFTVRATDRAGNTDPSPAEESWTTCFECAVERTNRSQPGVPGPSEAATSTGATSGSVGGVGGAVEETVEAVQDTVETVTETVEDAVEDVTDARPSPDLPQLPVPTPSLDLLGR
ncbi:MAG: hypothetical protein ACRDJP_11320, partial [Actinomycetota bacterium]